jgi:hypothetical protein
MNHLQPLADSASPFFKLSREIRAQIYDHLWNDTRKIRQWYKQNRYTVTYNLDTKDEATIPHKTATWLLTNKQMLHEGIQQLHQNSAWHFADHNSYDGSARTLYYTFPLTILHRRGRTTSPLTGH